MKYLIPLFLWVAAVGLVGLSASPTSGNGLAQATVVLPATRAVPLGATPTLNPDPPPVPLPYITPATLDATADLLLSYDAPALVHRGGTVQVRYTIVNLGPAPVRGATFIAALPPSYYLNNVRVYMGWSCNVQGYSTATLTRPVTIICQRDNWLLAKIPEDIRLDLTLTTSALDRNFLGIQAAVISTGIDNTPNWVLYAPGIDN
jgi:hypothetical protein